MITDNLKKRTESAGLLFLDVLYLFPLSLQVLLPQTDFVVPSAYGKYVSTGAPAHSPEDSVEFKLLASPLAGVRCIGSPDANCLVLRCRSNVGFGKDAGRPGDVTDPVGVALQGLRDVVSLAFRAVSVGG